MSEEPAKPDTSKSPAVSPHIKNPRRVDASLRAHVSRYQRQRKHAIIWTITAIAAIVACVIFQPWKWQTTICVEWVLALIALIAAFNVLKLTLKQKATLRKLLGTCRTCDYDLRATDDRCPECGAEIPEQLRLARQAGKDRSYMPKQS